MAASWLQHIVSRHIVIAIAACAATRAATAQTLYAVVLGNPKYLVGASTLESGLFTSRDGGRTWRQLGPRNVKGYSMDAVDAERGRILYMAAGNGVHRSTDSGASWKIVTDWRITEVLDVRVDQRDPRRVYAATASGFWRSNDAGDHWESPAGGLHERYCYRFLAVDDHTVGNATVGDPDALLVATDGSTMYSSDHGTTWQRAADTVPVRDRLMIPKGSPGPFTGRDWYLVARSDGPLAVAEPDSVPRGLRDTPVMNVYQLLATPAGIVYAAGDGGLWQYDLKRNDLRRWQDATTNLPNHIVHAVTYFGDAIIAGTFGGGLFRLEHDAWSPSGLEGAMVWSLHRKEW